MQDNYVKAGSALRIMFVGQMVVIIAGVLSLRNGMGIIPSAVTLMGNGLVFYGVFSARTAHVGYRYALYAQAVSLLCNLIGSLLPEGHTTVLTVLSVIITIANPVALYFICSTSAKFLEHHGGEDALADRGNLVWKIAVACFVADLACVAMGWTQMLDMFIAVAQVVILVARLVAYVLLVMFYYSASNALLK